MVQGSRECHTRGVGSSAPKNKGGRGETYFPQCLIFLFIVYLKSLVNSFRTFPREGVWVSSAAPTNWSKLC